MSYLISPKLIDIKFNGQTFKAIKEIIDDHLIIGNEEFSNRYDFELEEEDNIIIFPRELLENVMKLLLIDDILDDSCFPNISIDSNVIRFLDKYSKHDSLRHKTHMCALGQYINKILDAIKTPSEELVELYSSFTSGYDSDADEDPDYYVSYEIGTLLRHLEEIFNAKSLHDYCSDEDHEINKYIDFVVFRANESLYHKWKYYNVYNLCPLLDDDSFNAILRVIADDVGIEPCGIYFTRDWTYKLPDAKKTADNNSLMEKFLETNANVRQKKK